MYKKTILVLGAGFGGLRAALLLDKKIRNNNLREAYRVVLLDKNDYHTYTPTLYEIATTAKDVANLCDLKSVVTFPITEIIENTHIEFIRSEVQHVDARLGEVHLAGGGVINFDYAIFALGAEVNYFGIPGLERNAFTLKTFTDAIRIRERITDEATNPDRGIFRIVIGGGGSTGVELAAEIQMWLCSLGKNTSKVCWATISIIEGTSSVLSNFGPHIVKLAKERIDAIGAVRVTQDKIKNVKEGVIELESGASLPYDMLIWTGGVKANHLMTDVADQLLHADKRLYTDDTMRCLIGDPTLKLSSSIYAIGDAACFINQKTQRPVPMVAPAAIGQAAIAAHNLMEEIFLAEGIKPNLSLRRYRPYEYPYIIPIGGKFAIARVGKIVMSGLAGWMLKGLVELRYLVLVMPKVKAVQVWLKGLKIFVQNNRLG